MFAPTPWSFVYIIKHQKVIDHFPGTFSKLGGICCHSDCLFIHPSKPNVITIIYYSSNAIEKYPCDLYKQSHKIYGKLLRKLNQIRKSDRFDVSLINCWCGVAAFQNLCTTELQMNVI